MGKDKLGFTGINYGVCSYCNDLIRGAHRDGYREGCKKLEQTDGKYARIPLGDKGCEQFESSGVPAHPQVLEELIQTNPKCSSIPSDSKATETSWDFSDKMNEHLPEENITSYDKVQ